MFVNYENLFVLMSTRKHNVYQNSYQKWFLKSRQNSIQIPVKSSFFVKVRLLTFLLKAIEVQSEK